MKLSLHVCACVCIHIFLCNSSVNNSVLLYLPGREITLRLEIFYLNFHL